MEKQSINKSAMLRKTRDFQRIYRQGVSYGSHLVVLIVRKKKGPTRVGMVCGKKVGNAVMRNRARRLLKENYRVRCAQINDGYDLVWIGRAPLYHATYAEVGTTMDRLLKKAGVTGCSNDQ